MKWKKYIMMMNKKLILALSAVSIIFSFFATSCFANDNMQQIAEISQEIQTLQKQLNDANIKIEKLCDSSTIKDKTTQTAPTQIHRTANGHGR